MRFLGDMAVDVRVVDWLSQRGHDAKHLRDDGLRRAPDEAIFQKGITEGRIILTFDLDFSEIAVFAGRRKASVSLFRLRNARFAHVIERLEAVLESSSGALEGGAIVTVEDARHRIRRLPIGAD